MKTRTVITLILCLSCAALALIPSRAMSESQDTFADSVEVKLLSDKIIKGVLVKILPKQIIVDQGGDRSPFYVPKIRINYSDIAGICRRGETVFLPLNESPILAGRVPNLDIQTVKIRPVYRMRKYDYLPLMGLAILGGVYAGNRFGKASSEQDAADVCQELGLEGMARQLESDAGKHRKQGNIGVVFGLLSLVIACIPSYDEIPLPTVSSSNDSQTDIFVCFDVSALVFREHREASKTGRI